jgi:hypothetical protein
MERWCLLWRWRLAGWWDERVEGQFVFPQSPFGKRRLLTMTPRSGSKGR